MRRNLLSLALLMAAIVLGVDSGVGQTTQPHNPADAAPSRGGTRPPGWDHSHQPGIVFAEQQPARRHLTGTELPSGVRHRVPQDYATIQAAIDASADGDTVLVSEGTYDESIWFSGKAIVVTSLYVVDRDTSHIRKTIITGYQFALADSGSIVYFIDGEDTTSVLNGFTITGGMGTRLYDNGWYRFGGGIYCQNAGARITNNIIARNRIVAETSDVGAIGGGIGAASYSMTLPYVIVEGNRITDNYVECKQNFAGSGGARFYSVNIRFVGNIVERDTVTGVMAEDGGIGIVADVAHSGIPHPRGYVKGNIFRSNILNASNQGAVGAGMTVANTDEVTIQENLFENNIGTSTSGWAMGALIVDDQYINDAGRKTIVKNRFLKNHLTNGVGGDDGCGAGITLYRTSARLDANEIADNGANGWGAGIYAHASTFRIENNIIARNVTSTNGGGVCVYGILHLGAEQAIINNTITGNRASSKGGGLTVTLGAVVGLNNILWADTAQTGSEISGAPTVRYSDVQGGWSGEGNIDADPVFAPDDTMFNLKPSSPCIGHGIDSIQIGGVWYNASTSDFDGDGRPYPGHVQGPDMGAQEEQLTTDVGEYAGYPTSYALEQNYPNPFNPTTVVSYQLSVASDVKLGVYDLLGREVAVLVNEVQQPGTYSVEFDGSKLASGVYVYRLSAGRFVECRKMILMK